MKVEAQWNIWNRFLSSSKPQNFIRKRELNFQKKRAYRQSIPGNATFSLISAVFFFSLSLIHISKYREMSPFNVTQCQQGAVAPWVLLATVILKGRATSVRSAPYPLRSTLHKYCQMISQNTVWVIKPTWILYNFSSKFYQSFIHLSDHKQGRKNKFIKPNSSEINHIFL